jgi:hypothetical protein
VNNTEISLINPSLLKPATWRANYILKPDLKVLISSIEKYGLLSPIVVQKKSNVIIDGHQRVIAISQSKALTKQYSKSITCIELDISDLDAMILHVQINRGRGSVVAKRMSDIVKKIYQSRVYSMDELDEIFNMTVQESDMMLDGSLVKMRKVKEHAYSSAWVPIEAPAKSSDKIALEKPPNEDR